MASTSTVGATNGISTNHVEIPIPIPIHSISVEQKPRQVVVDNNEEEEEESNNIDYFQRAQWLRAAMLGANDGLVTVASLMIGIGAVKEDISAMLLAGFAGLIAGACSMAIGEFVSVYTQYDIEMAQIKRRRRTRQRETNNNNNNYNVSVVLEGESEREDGDDEKLPNPFQAALASALAFSVGAMMPLLAAAFIRDHKVRMGVVGGVVSLALLVFGGVGAVLGKTPIMRSCFRVVIGGWMAMAITFGLTKWIGAAGL